MTPSTLRQLYDDNKGKVSDKWSSYLEVYDELFSPYRDQKVRLLEIGIQNGGSLEIWSKYFPKAELLLGSDIDEACRTLRYADPRIQLVIGDANTDAAQNEILQLSSEFDLIIDDGSHRSGDIVSTFFRYFPNLKVDGLYVAEDLHCSYWKAYQGGLFDPLSAISFFKRLADVVNFEHWGVAGKRADLLRSFAEAYGCVSLVEDLARIYSVEFRNSICTVRKKTAVGASLGPRIVSGDDAQIVPHILALSRGTLSDVYRADESTNEWSNLVCPPETELVELRTIKSTLTQEVERISADLQGVRLEYANIQQQLNVLYRSRSWRLTSPLRKLASWIRRSFERPGILTLLCRLTPLSPNRAAPIPAYSDWVDKFDTLRHTDRTLISAHITETALPELLVIWFLPGNDPNALLEAASSLIQQLSSNWKAVLVSESPASSEVDALVKAHVQLSVRRGLSVAELAVSRADYFLVIKGAGQLAEHATYMFGVQVRRMPGAVCCDEDVAGPGGRHSPRFAPTYSREFSAVGSLILLPRTDALARSLTTTRESEVDLEQLIPRDASDTTIDISHIAFILFHGRSAPTFSLRETQDCLEDGRRVPKISIIIPTKDRLDLLEPCVTSILARTDYPRESYELVVVDNGSTDSAMHHYLSQMVHSKSITVFRDPRPFNYSRLNNQAAAMTDAELLAFVNNDTVVLDPLWLRRLAFQAIKPRVGAVGGKLLYPDQKVQHGGVVLGIQGVAAHAHVNLDADAPGYMGLSNSTHAVSAVTGACLVLKRSAFREVGGFDENLAVAFGDVLLCIELTRRGYRNLYIGTPLLVHFESKTRGYDDSAIKQEVFRKEARYARRKGQSLFKSDPFYNDNLSLEEPYDLAVPPRVEKPWNQFRRQSTGRLRILMLSSTHQVGHGVPVVLNLQARHLAAEGHQVFVGGPLGENDVQYPGCTRVFLNQPRDAAVFAVQHDIDCVVMHTPPFYSTTRWLGASVKTLAYDYGEPNPEFFPNAAERRLQLQEKAFCLEMADALYAISESVRVEAAQERMGVIPVGNSHLAKWDQSLTQTRIAKRAALGLSDRVVVLNVCRFSEAERNYKGLDTYCSVKDKVSGLFPDQVDKYIFLLAGKGTVADVKEMEGRGLRVFANISNEELVDLYCCADVYANFSRWEGHNLGIGQALAMGLPVVASDIPAHRAFKVFVSNDSVDAAQQLVTLAHADQKRIATVTEWFELLEMFSRAIMQLNFPSTNYGTR